MQIQIKITPMEVLAIIMIFVTIGFLIGSNFLLFQKEKIPSVKLTSIDGTEFYSDHVIGGGDNPVIVVFWRPSQPDLSWQFEQMLEARKEIMGDTPARIVAVYDSSFGQRPELQWAIKDYLTRERPDIEVYFDGKAKMRKMLGIPQVPYTMVFNEGSNEIQYFGFKIYNDNESFETGKQRFAVD